MNVIKYQVNKKKKMSYNVKNSAYRHWWSDKCEKATPEYFRSFFFFINIEKRVISKETTYLRWTNVKQKLLELQWRRMKYIDVDQK